MSAFFEIPRITAPDAEGKIEQLRAYIFALVQQLEYAVGTSGAAKSTSAESGTAGGDSASYESGGWNITRGENGRTEAISETKYVDLTSDGVNTFQSFATLPDLGQLVAVIPTMRGNGIPYIQSITSNNSVTLGVYKTGTGTYTNVPVRLLAVYI